MNIAGHTIGNNAKPFLIAEIAQAHDGSLGTAYAYIDAVAEAGADAIKFQTHIAKFESTLDEPFRVKFSRQDKSRYDYWKRMEFTEEQWAGLAEYANKKGLVFLSSSFSKEAVRLLQKLGVPAWKIGSGEFRSRELINAIIKTGLPVLLSTGMSTCQEIGEMVNICRSHKIEFGLFQCTSSYPTKLTEVGINVIAELKQRFNCPVGLSDHSGSLFPGLNALARGADMLEVHVIFDRQLFGPDAVASITLDDLKIMVQANAAFFIMNTSPVDKNEMAIKLTELRSIFSKSLAPVRPLKAGAIIDGTMFSEKKPGTGIPYQDLPKLIGRRLKRDVTPDRLLGWEDISD